MRTPDRPPMPIASGAGNDLPELTSLRRPAWMRDALCVEFPNVNFFPARGESTVEAKRVCARCLVRAECFDFAMGLGTTLEGIWGGVSAGTRRRLRSAPVEVRVVVEAIEALRQVAA